MNSEGMMSQVGYLVTQLTTAGCRDKTEDYYMPKRPIPMRPASHMPTQEVSPAELRGCDGRIIASYGVIERIYIFFMRHSGGRC